MFSSSNSPSSRQSGANSSDCRQPLLPKATSGSSSSLFSACLPWLRSNPQAQQEAREEKIQKALLTEVGIKELTKELVAAGRGRSTCTPDEHTLLRRIAEAVGESEDPALKDWFATTLRVSEPAVATGELRDFPAATQVSQCLL